jgi:integral membrane protein
VTTALFRYRVMAYVVGVGLLVLVGVAMPLKYVAHSRELITVVGPLHGFLYMVYLIAAANLGFTMRWRLRRTLLVVLAGAVPFLSFAMERRVTREVTDTMAGEDVEPSAATR